MKNNIRPGGNYVLKENSKKFDTERICFLSHISHGIRTPLNSIMGFSKLLALKELIDDKQKEYIQGILSGSNLLLQFVDNVIDLSQFEANNYSIRVKKYDINQMMWEFTESFYSRKIENNDTSINLMLVWDSKVKGLEIETDTRLLQKSIQRIINLVSVKYPIEEFELGYRLINNESIAIFLRPALEKLSQEDYLNEKQLYAVDEDNSFDFFNFRVLSKSVEILRGELHLSSDKQEYSFIIPLKYT